MAFRKKNVNEIFGTVLVLSALLSTASAVDCFGKSFHCVNSTHFMICVDLGGGVSQSIDDFLIPCPPPTVCQGSNHFECEFPAVTTPSTTLSNVISDTTEPWEEIVVTTNSPPKNTSTTKEYSEKYMNTVSITSVSEDNLTTDTTVDVTTEATPLSDVNSKQNVTEIVPTSPIYEVPTPFDGTTQTISNNIVTDAAEITTATPEDVPLHQIQNVTNEMKIDNVTLSNTEPTNTLNNNYTLAHNDSAGEVRNITGTSQSDNITSENITDNIVTPDTLLIDSSTGTERLLTSIADQSFVKGIDLVMTTAQPLVSTDEYISIQTTPEPALIQNTVGVEQFQQPFFEQNFTTESVQNSEKEQSTDLTPDVQNVPAQLPITTFQSTVTTATSTAIKDEITAETTIASEHTTTMMDKVNFSIADIYTTEAPLTTDTSTKQDIHNTSTSDQVPTNLTDNAFVYSGNKQPTTDINNIQTTIDVTTEQSIAVTTETQNIPVTEQLKIMNENSQTEQVQKLIDTAITAKPSDLATETQQQQGTEHTAIIKNVTTGNDAPARAILPTEIQKPIDIKVEQSKNSTQNLAIDNYALTENPSEFTTESQKLPVTEQPTINKDNSATEQVQKLIDTGIESPKYSNKTLTTVQDVITENPIDLTTETQHQQTEQNGTRAEVINRNITTTSNVMTAGVSVLPTEVQKSNDKGIEQSKDSIQNLVIVNGTLTENPNEITIESPKLVKATPITTNKNSSVTSNDALTEASILLSENQKPMHKGVEQEKIRTTSLPTETVTDFTTVTQKSMYVSTELLTTIRSDLLPTEKAVTYTTDTYEPTKQITEEIKPIANKNDITTENYVTTEKISDFTAETQKLIDTSTEQPIKESKSPATQTITENSALNVLTEKTIYRSTPQPYTKATDIDLNVAKANVSAIATSQPVSMNTELPTTAKNDLATNIEVTTETSIGSTTITSKSTIRIQEGAIESNDNHIVIEQQKPGITTTDTIPLAVVTTDRATQSLGVAERFITNAPGDSIMTDNTISNLTKLQNNATTTGTIVVQTINETTATTNEPTTIEMVEDKIKGEMTTETGSVSVDNVQMTYNTINEEPNKNTLEAKVGTNVVTTVKSVDIDQDGEATTAEYMPNLNNAHQLSTNIDRSNTTNATTTDATYTRNIINEVNTSINDNAIYDTSTVGINEINYLSPNTVKITQDAQNVVGIVDKNQYTTDDSSKIVGTAFTTKETNNVDGSDVAISNNAGINEHTSTTDKAKSELHTIERVNLISVENIGNQLSATETTATTDWGSVSTLNLSPVKDSLDSNLKEVINKENQMKNSNSAYSGTLAGAEVTSETTATENFTPSLYPNNESSSNDKYLTSNNQVNTENIYSVIDNAGGGLNSINTSSNTNLKQKDDDLNTPLKENKNTYVSFTTEKSASFHDNIANNQIPTVNGNEIHETLQGSSPTNTLQPSFVNNANNELHDITSTTRVIGNTGTAFTQKSRTVSGIDFESHVSNKNVTDQPVQITAQTFHTRQPMPTTASNENINNLLHNPLYNILVDKKINQTINSATESAAPSTTAINNDGNINSMDVSSSDTYTTMDYSSTQITQIQNANGVTTQASILIVPNDNLPSSALDSLSATDVLYKSIPKIDNPSVIQPEANHKETSITKEALYLNGDNVVKSSAVTMTDVTTKSSIIENVKNVYKTIGSYFNTQSQTSNPGSIKEKENGAIGVNGPILSPHDFQDSTKTSSSMYNTESSIQGIKDNYDLIISKLEPVPTVRNLQPAAHSGYNTETSKIEITSEASKNNEEGNIILNKHIISAALPVPDYKIEINTHNINKPVPIASQGTKTSETKLSQETYHSATYNPNKYVTSTIHNYQGSDSTIHISSEASLSSPQTAFKTDAKILPEQKNVQNLAIPSKSQYNSSLHTDTASSGSNLILVIQPNDLKLSNNVANSANEQSYSKSQSNSTIVTSKVAEKVGLATNTTKNENSGAIEKNPLKGSLGPFVVSVTTSKNVSQDTNKNRSSLSQNSTNTTKYNTHGGLVAKQKITTNSTNSSQVHPATTKQKKMHSVTQAPTAKIAPRPTVLMTATENPSKQIPKTAPINFSCINGIRGRYSDKDDCRKFYICFGHSQPIVGNCPANSVFSDISKLCTKNLSHCIRENEFKCPSAGRFSDVKKNNVYYICVSYKNHFYRFKFQCQKGFALNKTRCEERREIVSSPTVPISLRENSNDGSMSVSSTTSSSSSTTSSASGVSSSSSSDSSSTSSDRSSSSSSSSSSSASSVSSSSSSDSSSTSSDSSSSMSTSSDSSSSMSTRSDSSSSMSTTSSDSSTSSSTESSSGDSNSSTSKDNSNSSNDSSSSKSKKKKENKENKESKEKPEEKERDEEDEVFECEKEGKFPVRNNCKRYYLCKKNGKSEYRRKIKKCESGEVFHKDKKNSKNSNESDDSESDGDRRSSNRRHRKEKKEEPEVKEDKDDHNEVFECEREGKFPVPGDCRRYYLCKKNRKSEYRRKIQKCDSDEVFHKSKKKCVDADSYEC